MMLFRWIRTRFLGRDAEVKRLREDRSNEYIYDMMLSGWKMQYSDGKRFCSSRWGSA